MRHIFLLKLDALPVTNTHLFPRKVMFLSNSTCLHGKLKINEGGPHLQLLLNVKTRRYKHTHPIIIITVTFTLIPLFHVCLGSCFISCSRHLSVKLVCCKFLRSCPLGLYAFEVLQEYLEPSFPKLTHFLIFFLP